MMGRFCVGVLGCAVALAALHAPTAARPAITRKAEVALAPLSIQTGGGLRKFRVEVARTPDEQARGLMYRTGLPRDGGMIFPLPGAASVAFWMKNTLIPLDMIFIRADGSIARIAANTVPQSLVPVESGEPVVAVLEIAGGGAEAAGIRPGDIVRW